MLTVQSYSLDVNAAHASYMIILECNKFAGKKNEKMNSENW